MSGPLGFFKRQREAARRRAGVILERQGCLVVPTTLFLARAWADGKIGDMELFFRTNTFTPAGQALFALSVYGHRGVSSFVRQVIAWPGARAGVFRTDNPIVEGWGKNFGFEFVYREEKGQWRLYGDAGALQQFRRRFA
jgi:hypothetical protein